MYGGGQQAGGLVLVYNVAIAPTELLAQGGNLPSGFSETDLASLFSAYSSAHSFRLLEDFSLAAVSFSSFEEMHHAQASLDSRVTYGSTALAVRVATSAEVEWYYTLLQILPRVLLNYPDWPPHRSRFRRFATRVAAGRGISDWHLLSGLGDEITRCNMKRFVFPSSQAQSSPKLQPLLAQEGDLFELRKSPRSHTLTEFRLKPNNGSHNNAGFGAGAGSPPSLAALGSMLDAVAAYQSQPEPSYNFGYSRYPASYPATPTAAAYPTTATAAGYSGNNSTPVFPPTYSSSYQGSYSTPYATAPSAQLTQYSAYEGGASPFASAAGQSYAAPASYSTQPTGQMFFSPPPAAAAAAAAAHMPFSTQPDHQLYASSGSFPVVASESSLGSSGIRDGIHTQQVHPALPTVFNEQGEMFKVFPPTWIAHAEGPNPHATLAALENERFAARPIVIIQLSEALCEAPNQPIPCEIGAVDFTLPAGKVHSKFHALIEVGHLPPTLAPAHSFSMARKHGIPLSGPNVSCNYKKIWSDLFQFLEKAAPPNGSLPPIYAKGPARQLQMLRWLAKKAGMTDFGIILPPILPLEDLVELIQAKARSSTPVHEVCDFMSNALLTGDSEQLLRLSANPHFNPLNSKEPQMLRRCPFHQKIFLYSGSLTNDPESKDRAILRCALASAQISALLLSQIFKNAQSPVGGSRLGR